MYVVNSFLFISFCYFVRLVISFYFVRSFVALYLCFFNRSIILCVEFQRAPILVPVYFVFCFCVVRSFLM